MICDLEDGKTERSGGPVRPLCCFFRIFSFLSAEAVLVPADGRDGSPCLGGEDSCETKPIPRLRIQDRVAAGHPLRPATLAPDGLPGDEMRKTNPIPGRVSSSEFPVSRRARLWLGLHTSHFTLQTRPKAIRAKRTQFRAAGIPPPFQHSIIPLSQSAADCAKRSQLRQGKSAGRG